MKQTGTGIPFPVKLRTYLSHACIAPIALLIYLLLFSFLFEEAVVACAQLRRIVCAPQSEVIFSGLPTGEDTFYYLNSYHLVGEKQSNVICDIYMTAEGHLYGNNDIWFEGTLEEGCCAVSENLAREYGLHLGQRAKISGSEKVFTVQRYLPAQSGLDSEALRKGIVVLSYDEELLGKPFSYLSFASEGDAYPALISLLFIKNGFAGNLWKLCLYFAIAYCTFAATVGVLEYFLFSSRRRDYATLVALGMRPSRLFFTVLAENALKYLLPLLPVCIGYGVMFAPFRAMCLAPILVFFPAAALTIIIYTAISARRLVSCHAKAKRS